MLNMLQRDSSPSPSSSVSGNRVDLTFHLFCGLHISYMFWSKHMPMVTECYSLFPSVTQWSQPCQLLGNLSTDASGVQPGICPVMEMRKYKDFMGEQILCLSSALALAASALSHPSSASSTPLPPPSICPSEALAPALETPAPSSRSLTLACAM
jgi:hypothetical protein